MDNMRKKQEETGIKIDDSLFQEERVPIKKEVEETQESKEIRVRSITESEDNLINCLKNEKIIVRFIARPRGNVTDPKHVLFGGMAEGAKMYITTPMLRNGYYVDVLTKEEKRYLEHILGFEPNALSIYNKSNNFWDDSNPNGIGTIQLIKGDTYLDLSKPIDYIKYKILLNCKNLIAPSMQALQENPKITYRFILIKEGDTAKDANLKVSLKSKAYMEFGKINEDKEKLRTIIEIIDGRPTAANSKIEFLQAKVGDILESNTKLFLQVVSDPYLDNKILLKKAVEAGVVSKRGNYYYLREDNSPLCGNNEEPTLNIAAKFLALPKNQEFKFAIEAKTKNV